MEQTVNVFNKGMQCDTHPMVLGKDSLTNALNATFITMNGNEVVLQNDMGNRRVNLAYLPPGYEPVGIKEYGGIIYVAAYNPITGKGLLGSFPSPLKRFSTVDNNDKLKINIDLVSDLSDNLFGLVRKKSFKEILGIDNSSTHLFIDNFQKIYTFGDEYPLHIGDKFCLYGDISGFFDGEHPLVSNIFNVTSNGVYSPKNRLFSLEVGILNSENNFVDLTNSLVRWGVSGNYLPSEDYFNETYNLLGCFIKNSSETNLINTESDKEFEESREVDLDLKNTYQYKLSGPLCIRETVNHIQSFSTNIKIGYTSETDTDNETLDQTLQNQYFNCFDLFIDGIITNNCKVKSNLVTYDSISNLYTRKLTLVYKVIKELNLDSDSTPITCIIAPKLINNNGEPFGGTNEISYDSEDCQLTLLISYTATYNSPDPKPNNSYHDPSVECPTMNELPIIFNTKEDGSGTSLPVYIENLCSAVTYDLNKINSGTLDIIDWRTYYNSEIKLLELNYSLLAYPKIDETYNNIRLLIFDSNPEEDDYIYTREQLNLTAKEWNVLLNILPHRDRDNNYYYPIVIKKSFDSEDFSINTGIILFGEDELKPSKIYNVEIVYDIINEENFSSELGVFGDHKYWLMTTILFNNCYSRGSNQFISNYVSPNTDESIIKNKLLTLELDLIPEFSITDSTATTVRSGNNIFYNGNGGGKILASTPKQNLLNFNSNLKLDENKYPKYHFSSKNVSGTLTDVPYLKLLIKDYNIIGSSNISFEVDNLIDLVNFDASNVNLIELQYNVNEFLKFNSRRLVEKFYNPYISIVDAFSIYDTQSTILPRVVNSEANNYLVYNMDNWSGWSPLYGQYAGSLLSLIEPENRISSGIILNDWTDTMFSNGYLTNILSYGMPPIVNSDGSLRCNSFMNYEGGNWKYYNSAWTNHTCMVLMKSASENRYHKKYFLYTGRGKNNPNTRLENVLENEPHTNCYESSKTFGSWDMFKDLLAIMFNNLLGTNFTCDNVNNFIWIKTKKKLEDNNNILSRWVPDLSASAYTNLEYDFTNTNPQIVLNLISTQTYSYTIEQEQNPRVNFTIPGSLTFENVSLDLKVSLNNSFLNFIEELKGNNINTNVLILENSVYKYLPEYFIPFSQDFYRLTTNNTFEEHSYGPEWKINFDLENNPTFRSLIDNPPKIKSNEILYCGGTKPTTLWRFVKNNDNSEQKYSDTLDSSWVDRLTTQLNYASSSYVNPTTGETLSNCWIPCNAWF